MRIVVHSMEGNAGAAVLAGIQKKRGVVLLRFTDGTEKTVPACLFGALKLRGQHAVQKDCLLKQIDEMQYPSARQKALALLTLRNRSSKSLRQALVKNGFDEPIADAVLDFLTGTGCLNDRLYAEAVIRQRNAQGFGRKRILPDLLSKGIDRDTAESALEAFYQTEEDNGPALRKSLRKAVRGRDLSDIKERQKAIAYLMRKGFTLSEALEGIKTQI